MSAGSSLGLDLYQSARRPQAARPHDASSLERAAEGAAQLPPGQSATLVSLMLAGLPRHAPEDCDVLWPVWASEAVCRVEGLLTLTALLDRSRCGGADRLTRRMDRDLARSVATQYQLLQTGPLRMPAPCSPVLRNMISALVSLFGEAAGGLPASFEVARLILPGFQRRALVLAVSTLVIDALIRQAAAPTAGLLVITLRHTRQTARLRVTADVAISATGPAAMTALAMAELLDGQLSYEVEGGGAEIVFPVSPMSQRGWPAPPACASDDQPYTSGLRL